MSVVEKITEHFKEGYYCDRDAVTDAIKHQSIFNIIDFVSGFKADFVILKETAFRQTEFDRRTKALFFGVPISIVTAEDLLLLKLIWIQELQSSIQMEDVKNLGQKNDLDWEYIRYWIEKIEVEYL